MAVDGASGITFKFKQYLRTGSFRPWREGVEGRVNMVKTSKTTLPLTTSSSINFHKPIKSDCKNSH